MILKKKYSRQYALGGAMPQILSMLGQTADSIDPGNQYGQQSTATTLLKGAASGASLGTSIAPGIGTAIGAGAGLVTGLITDRKNKQLAREADFRRQRAQDQAIRNRSSAVIGNNPALVTGQPGSEFYAAGGYLETDGGGGGGHFRGGGVGRKFNKPELNKKIVQSGSTLFSNSLTDLLDAPQKGAMKLLTGEAQKPSDWLKKHGYPNPYLGFAADVVLDPLNAIPLFGTSKYKNLTAGKSLFNKVVKTVNTVDNVSDTGEFITNQTKAAGGFLKSRYMARASGGTLNPMSSDSVEVQGPSHEQGGVDLPAYNSEVEGGETIQDDYVFSKRLGFADRHKKLAKAVGKIEQKPATPDRVNALKALNTQIQNLQQLQEQIRQQNNLQ